MNAILKVLCGCVVISFLVACSTSAPVSYTADKTKYTPRVNSRLVTKNLLLVNSLVTNASVSKRVESGISENYLSQLFLNLAKERLQFEVLSGSSKGQAEAVLKLELTNYKQLQGSAVGASQGAEVGFVMKLYSKNSRELLWEASFFHKDLALSDDVLALGRSEANRYGWNNANNLLRKGLEQALTNLNNARKDLFLADKK